MAHTSKQKTVLITGCSDGGLGAALSLAFHKAGWRVFASARNMARVKEVAAAGIETVQLDVTSAESIATSVSRVRELAGGSLDVLLNNAGAGYSMPLMDVDMAKARELFDLNVFSILTVTQAYLPLLMKSTGGSGMVINNTSITSQPIGALPLQGIYNASKAAAASLTENLRLELAPFGIRVINLMTGVIRTRFLDNAPTATLPPSSLYNVAKEAIESSMARKDIEAIGSDRDEWAGLVVKDISKSNPPHLVWRGRYASEVRMGSLLPMGCLDHVIKNKSGLDVLDKMMKGPRNSI